MVTVNTARKRLRRIREEAWDDEVAHDDEDRLRADVLQAIVDGSPDYKALARIALSTRKIQFSRWCA
jgi:hypothetical protein